MPLPFFDVNKQTHTMHLEEAPPWCFQPSPSLWTWTISSFFNIINNIYIHDDYIYMMLYIYIYHTHIFLHLSISWEKIPVSGIISQKLFTFIRVLIYIVKCPCHRFCEITYHTHSWSNQYLKALVIK